MPRRLALFALLVGAALFCLGSVRYNREATPTPEPEVVTASNLVAKGPPSNVDVRNTEGTPVFNEAVKLSTPMLRSYVGEDMFLPLTTTPARIGDKPVLAAIVRMSPDELASYRGGPLRGIQIKTLGRVNEKVADRLAKTYGMAAVERALFIHHRREPAGLGTAFALLGSGVVLIVAGTMTYRKKPTPPQGSHARRCRYAVAGLNRGPAAVPTRMEGSEASGMVAGVEFCRSGCRNQPC